MKNSPESTFKRNLLATSIRLENLTLGGVLASQLLLATAVSAGPTGEVIVAGTGLVSRMDSTTRIEQTSSHLAINWNTFNVGQHETVKFVQPSSSALVLNRILDQNPSRIRGSIDANGNVLLVNPRGILFTDTARVNVGGLVASGLDISVDDFMNGELLFKGIDGSRGAVVNQGVINASSAALIGKSVHNAAEALISADLVSLATGDEAVLTFDSDRMLGVRVTREVLANELGLSDALLNEGRIEGNRVLLTASASRGLFANAINNAGVVTAASIDSNGGTIRLMGSGSRISNSGEIRAAGSGSSITMAAGELVNQGQITAAGAAGDPASIRIDAAELHNAGSIAGGAGGMAIEVGQEGSDRQHTLGQLAGAGEIQVHARGGASGTDGFAFAAGGHYQLGARDVISTEGITITGADWIDAGGEGRVQGRDEVADAFTITGNKTVRVNATTFSNITSVAGGGGAAIDSVTGADRWQLQGSRTVSAEGIVFTDVEQVGSETLESWVLGRDSVAEAFVITGDRMLTAEGLAFTNVTRVHAGEGAQADRVTGASEWLLKGQQSVSAAGIVFNGIEQAGSDTSATLTGRDNSADTFVLRGSNTLTVNDITFTNIVEVNAGTGTAQDRVVGGGEWTLNGSRSVQTEGITFNDVEQVEGVGAGSSIFAREEAAESFVISGHKSLRVDGINFSNVAIVNAGAGAAADTVSGAANWELQGSHRARAQGILFTDIEQVEGGGVELNIIGRDDVAESIAVTGSRRLTVDGMAFFNVASVSMGGGAVADQLSGANYWTLNGEKSVVAGGMAFSGVEQVTGSGTHSTLTGRNEEAETFTVTGSKALTANGMAFDNIAVVNAGSGLTPDRVTGSDDWLLNGNQSVKTLDMTFYGVEEVGRSGDNSQVTGSTNSTETFALTGNNRVTVAGMNFAGVGWISGQSTDRVEDTGDLHYELQSQTEARAANIQLQGLVLANIHWEAGDAISVASGHSLNGGAIDSKGARLLGSQQGDAFSISGANTVDYSEVKFTHVTQVDGRGGQDTVNAAGEWALLGSGSVAAHGISFANIEQAGSVAADSEVRGRDGVAESFVITGDKALSVDGITFTNVTSVHGGSGGAADSVSGAASWQLNGSGGLAAAGITFTHIEQAGTAGRAGTLFGRNDVGESFVITGEQALIVDGIAFTDIASVEAGSGAVTDRVSGAADWALQGWQSVSAAGITFTGVEQAGQAGQTSRIAGRDGVGESFEITGYQAVTADGIRFTGVTSVNAGHGDTVDRITGADQWQLIGHQGVSAAGITFTGIEAAGDGDAAATLRGRNDVVDTFVINGESAVTASGITFTNLIAVEGGSGAADDRVSGAAEWILNGHLSVRAGDILFTGIERADSVGSRARLTGRDHIGEAFAITGPGGLAVDGITFTGISRVEAGHGAADSVAGASQWQLNGTRSVIAEGFTFIGIEQVGGAGQASGNERVNRILGQPDVAETFLLTGPNTLAVDGLRFINVAEVDAGSGAGDRVESVSPIVWQLTGEQQALIAEGITFNAVEAAQHVSGGSGYSQVVGSAVADRFQVAGTHEIIANGVRISGIDRVAGGGNQDGSDVLTSNRIEVWQLGTDASVQVEHSGIRFNGLEEVQGAMGSSLQGTAGDDHFVLGAEANRVSRDNLTYTNLTRIDGGAGEDTLSAGAGYIWQLTGTHKELVANGITYSNIEVAAATGATVKGRDGEAEIFDIGSDQQQVRVHGLTFQGISQVDAGAGADDTIISHREREWQLTGAPNSLQAAGMVFTGIDAAHFAPAVTALGSLRGSAVDETFDISGSQHQALSVNGIAFTGIGSVAAAGGSNRVVSSDAERWSLTGVNGEFNAEDIRFTDVSSAGAKFGTAVLSSLRGSADDEIYAIDAQHQHLEVAGIRFDHLGSVDAGDGQDTVYNSRATHWRAVEAGGKWATQSAETLINSIRVVFANIEQVLNTGSYTGPATGAGYILTDAQTVKIGDIRFGGVSAIHAGSGLDTLYGLNLDTEWALNGHSGNTSYLTFTGIDAIRAGAARDIFTFDSGLAGNIYTGDGDDTVYLSGGSVTGLYLEEGSDQLFINNSASMVALLDGGTGEDTLIANLAGLTWHINGDVNQANYFSDGKLNYAFTGFERLRYGADDLRISTNHAVGFGVDQVVFEGAGIRLGYRPDGNVWLSSQHRGSNAVTGSISGRSLDIRTSGGVDLRTRIDRLSILNQGRPASDSLKIQVREADDLIIGQVYAGEGGTISLTSMGLGALTAEVRGVTHLQAGTVNLGSEWQRWSAIGEQMMPLRMEVSRAANIVALSYVEPEFVNGMPSFMATGNRLPSVAGAVASQGMKSAVQTNVEQFTQVDPAIFTSVSSYSVHAEALNAPEYALVAGDLVPVHGVVESSGDTDSDRTTFHAEDE